MTPTPEQIEAAAEAYWNAGTMVHRWEDESEDQRAIVRHRIKAALTAAAWVGLAVHYPLGRAAAGVGPQLPKFDWTDDAEVIKLWKFIGDATTERCAKVADSMAYVESCADDTVRGIANGEPYRKVAAAIRALKG